MKHIKNFFHKIGRRVINYINEVFDFYKFVILIFKSFKSLKYLHFRSIYNIAIDQTRFTGLGALPLVLSIAIILGATVIIQATKNFPKIGIQEYIGNLLVVIVTRELGPLATAMIVTSRSGSAITAQIATQKQNQEIRSLELIGINTKLYIIVPRIIAFSLSIFSLILIFNLAAFFGGYLISLTTVYIPITQFWQNLLSSTNFIDLIITLIKSMIYGLLIPIVCCYYGFKPNSLFEIPIYVSKAIVRTFLMLIIINALISAIFYF